MVEIVWWQLILVFAGSPVLAAFVTWLMTRKKTDADIMRGILAELRLEITRLSGANDRLELLYGEEKKSETSVSPITSDLE